VLGPANALSVDLVWLGRIGLVIMESFTYGLRHGRIADKLADTQ
jgi:hypothetical protein